MKYASVCSGVEAASLAWRPLGWEAAWFSEIEPFPCAVLAERFPGVPNLGDMTKIKIENTENGTKFSNANGTDVFVPGGIELLVGGTPCQDASVAGKRAGLVEGSRSRLAFDFTRIAYESRARFIVWENVPGCFSLNGGRDFAAFLSSLAGWDVAVPAGGWKSGGIVRNATPGNYGLAYRVLDAQYVRVDGFSYAVPQRRRRVFVVGCLGALERAAEILFDGEGVSWDSPPCRGKRKDFAGNFKSGAGETGRPWDETGVNPILNQSNRRCGTIGASNQELFAQNECAQTLHCMHDHGAVLCYENHAQDSRVKDCGEVSPQINAKAGTGGNNVPLCLSSSIVRKLLPVECERLMGFPDNWTRIPWRGKPETDCPDGPRYKACGNSMCVNVMRWIGMRIELSERKRNGL